LYSYGRGVVGYWAWPYYSQSINLTITCLQHFFNTVLEKEEDLPPVLFLQMDNAAKDNKNVVSLNSELVQATVSLFRHVISSIVSQDWSATEPNQPSPELHLHKPTHLCACYCDLLVS
jgi:hypothetical protein